MDLAAYAADAVRLANAELDDLDSLLRHVGDRDWHAERLTERDLRTLRGLRARIREVFAAAAAGDDAGAVDRLNSLLARSPVSPRVSGHDGARWHLHVTARSASAGDDLAAEALVGLAVAMVDHGPGRFGTCAGEGCADVFIDTSPGGTRRFCSSRCASRTNVAAFRARRRA